MLVKLRGVEMENKTSILIGQSGGPTAVINGSLYGIVKEACKEENIENIYGTIYGIDGIVNENIIKISLEEAKEWMMQPSAILGSVRFKLPEVKKGNETYERIISVLKKFNVSRFFYIGGNDSMDTCAKLNAYFKIVSFPCLVIGVPKTIDNDLIATDHTPGYGSSAKYIATTIQEIACDTGVYKDGRVTIVEVMGRDAGWLTAASAVANINGNGPDLVYIPEIPFSLDSFLKNVNDIYYRKRRVLVAVSEGIRFANGDYVLNYKEKHEQDNFGHLQLGGVAFVLSEIVKRRLALPTRSIELNLPQRCAAHLFSKTDLKEAVKVGSHAFLLSKKGVTGVMVSIRRINNNPYKTVYEAVSLETVANKMKPFPIEWMDVHKCLPNSLFSEYVLPLISGEVKLKYDNGIPKYRKR